MRWFGCPILTILGSVGGRRWVELRDREKVMPAIGIDDPEMSYRRGYQDGAGETFRAVERSLDLATREAVRAWIEQEVNRWRLTGVFGHPPTWRASGLTAPTSRYG